MEKPFSEIVLKREALLTAVLLTAIAILSYSDSFNTPFVFDDRNNILENPHIRITTLTPEKVSGVFKSRSAWRPLANLSFAANFFFNGYDVFGYHAVNLFIHVFMGLLVWMIARYTLFLCGFKYRSISLAAAVLWLVNPVHTQSITYIVQRMNAMAAALFLLALICYVAARKERIGGRTAFRYRLFFALCLITGVLGLATKQIVATLPAVLFVYEWYFFQGVSGQWLKKNLLLAGLAILVIGVLGFLYLCPAPMNNFHEMYARHDFTISQRLLTEAGIVIYYLSLLLYPHPDRLNIDYDFPLSQSWNSSVSTALALAALLSLAVMAIYTARKNRLLSFAILWYLMTLAVESSIIGLELIFEHRTYLPSVFPIIALVTLAFSRFRKKFLAISVLCLVITTCGFWTYKRNTVWSESVRLWSDAVDKAPKKSRPYNNLGFSLLLDGKNEQALQPLSRGLALAPSDPELNNTMAIASYLTGDIDKALDACHTALAVNPESIEARNTLGFILRQKGEVKTAEACFSIVLARTPDNFEALMNMGLIKQLQGDLQNAQSWFQKAVDVNPVSSQALYYVGSCLAARNQPGAATKYLKKALALDAGDYRVHCMLAAIMLQQQNPDAAVYHYKCALEIAPDCTVAGIGLAEALFAKKDLQTAQACLDSTIRYAPGDETLLWKAVQLLTEAGRYKKAAAYLETLTGFHPDNPKLLYNLACLYARQNDKRKAVNTLKRAIDRGYNNWSQIKTDKDLKAITETAYYKAIIY